MKSTVSLDSIPIVDDHCHAGMGLPRFHSILDFQVHYCRGFIEARVSPEGWRQYIAAMNSRNPSYVEEVEQRYGIRELARQALRDGPVPVFTRALRLGCEELYGEWEDWQRLEELSARARSDGDAPLYLQVLDRLGCRVALTDVPSLDTAHWPSDRFKWIARVDPFLYPFGWDASTGRGGPMTNETRNRYSNMLRLALEEQGLDSPPKDFGDYLAFVDKAVGSFLERGAVALKVGSAYLRPLEFQPQTYDEARRVYQYLVRGELEETRVIEDYVARQILLFAARNDVPVQFHTGIGLTAPAMNLNWSNPLLLQSLLMDEKYANLRLVLLHGSYPYCGEAAALVWTYGNVYLDFSWMVFLHSHHLADRLSEWLELLPSNRLMFGVDTGLPETQLGGGRLGLRALETALNRGVEASIWSPAEAHDLGERVLLRNACEVYRLS